MFYFNVEELTFFKAEKKVFAKWTGGGNDTLVAN